MKMRQKEILGSALCLLAVFGARADIFMLKNGMTDWTDPASYTNNALPMAEDRIFTETGATNELRPSNPKYGDSLDMINSVMQIQLGVGATLVIEVASGVTNTISGRIGCASTHIEDVATLVKQGAGTLLQEPRDNNTYYFSKWRVENGTLGAPWATNTVAATKNIYSYGIHIESGASLILSYKQTFQLLGPLSGSGSIYTLNPNTGNSGSPIYIKGGPGVFSGTIGTNVNIIAREAILDFTGTENRYNAGLTVSGYKDDGTGKGVLGFVKFGADANDPSSLGLRGTVTLGEVYGVDKVPLSGAFRYLGTTGESVTKKYISFGYTQDAPATFDAGAHGGLSFGKDVDWSVSEAHNQRFCLDGSNTVECSFAGSFVEGGKGSVYLIKRGSGAWHLKNNTGSQLSGPVCIEDGVLRHDSLASRGNLCALGTAANLHDGAYVAAGDETAVDYSVLFAGKGTGLLEYTGLYDACSSNRHVAVKTGGGFSSSSGAERIHGISAYDGEDTATMVILATNSAISTYADITDGTHGGRLGVTKRGSGTSELDRELSFSGPLKVEGGRLIVRNSSGAYTWFRLTVKENYGVTGGEATDYNDKNHVVIERFALYDTEGVRQNIGFTRHDGNMIPGGYGSRVGHAVKSPATGLRPGEIGFDRPGNVNVWATSNRDIQNICDASNSSLIGNYARYEGESETLSRDRPDTWVKYVMRVTNGTPEIASFDIAGRFSSTDNNTNRYRQPTVWMMEGSVDGVNWDVLTNMIWTANITGMKWYSDMTSSCYGTTSGRRWQEGKSFPIRGTPEVPASFNVLGNCESVSVAPGAVLEKQGGGDVEISALSVDAGGFGTIDGFVLAETGEIDVSGAGRISGKLEIPGTFANCRGLDHLASGWTVSAGGPCLYVVYGASASGLTVGPRGLIFTVR